MKLQIMCWECMLSVIICVLQAIVKACEGLAAKGEIREKVYGKQKVYVADQSQFPEVDDSEIKSMDSNITELTQQVQSTMEEVKRLESGKYSWDPLIT